MLKPVSNKAYDEKIEQMLKAYEKAGFTPVECMSDVTDYKARWASDDGYADGVIVGGISLLLAGIICKVLAKRELKQINNQVNAKLDYAMSIKPLTEFSVPTGEDDREENND